MKKATKLFTRCICLCAIASLIGGGCNSSSSDDEIKATVSKTTSSLVTVEKDSYTSIVSENDKTTVNAALDSAGIDKIIKSAADYSGFAKNAENSSYNESRSISANVRNENLFRAFGKIHGFCRKHSKLRKSLAVLHNNSGRNNRTSGRNKNDRSAVLYFSHSFLFKQRGSDKPGIFAKHFFNFIQRYENF